MVLQAYNCHEQGHFARQCTKPRVENNAERTMVPTGNNIDAPHNNDRAMVAQQFFWEDQMQTLNLTEDGRANLAPIEDGEEENKAEEKMIDLELAFMVSTTSSIDEVTKIACSQFCVDKMRKYCEHNDRLIRIVEDLKHEGYTLRIC